MPRKRMIGVLSVLIVSAALLSSCGTRSSDTTADTTAGQNSESITSSSETTTVSDDNAPVDDNPADDLTVADQADTDMTEASVSATSDVAGAEYGDPSTTNGKYKPDKTFAFVEGIRMDMTADEVISVLGEPDKEESAFGMKYLYYGESTLIFGNYTEFMQAFLNGEESQLDAAPVEEARLSIVQIGDNALPCYGGIGIGSTKEEVLDTFCHDLEDHTPEEMKEEHTRYIYGSEHVLNDDELDDVLEGDLHSGSGEPFKLALEATEDGDHILGYYDMDMSGSIYMLSFELDDDERVSTIMASLLDVSIYDEFESNASDDPDDDDLFDNDDDDTSDTDDDDFFDDDDD